MFETNNKHVTSIQIPIVTHSHRLCNCKWKHTKKSSSDAKLEKRATKNKCIFPFNQILLLQFENGENQMKMYQFPLNEWFTKCHSIELMCVWVQNEIWINKHFPISRTLHVIQSSIGALLFRDFHLTKRMGSWRNDRRRKNKREKERQTVNERNICNACWIYFNSMANWRQFGGCC